MLALVCLVVAVLDVADALARVSAVQDHAAHLVATALRAVVEVFWVFDLGHLVLVDLTAQG